MPRSFYKRSELDCVSVRRARAGGGTNWIDTKWGKEFRNGVGVEGKTENSGRGNSETKRKMKRNDDI